MAHCCKCGEEYPTARLKLGYRTCLDCGSPAPVRTIIPFHKSNYMLVTKREELVINPKLVGM